MHNFILSIMVLITFSLTGCSIFNKPEPRVETKTIYVHPRVPETLFTPCRLSKPITEEAYLRLSPEQREGYLTDYIVSSMGVVSTCNDRLIGIKTSLEESKKLHQ